MACREINAFPREFFPPIVIGVATIHTNHASWLVIEVFSHIDLMYFARSGKHEVRQIAIVFEAKLCYTVPWFGTLCKRRLSLIYFWLEIGFEPTIKPHFCGTAVPSGQFEGFLSRLRRFKKLPKGALSRKTRNKLTHF